MKLEITDKEKIGKFKNKMKLNNSFLNSQRIKEVIKREIKSFLRKLKWKHNILTLAGFSKSSSKRKFHNDKCLYIKKQEILQIRHFLCLKELEKQTEPKGSR